MKQETKVPPFFSFSLTVSVLILLLITIYRVVLFSYFNTTNTGFSDILPALLLGVRYDLRLVAILVFPLLLITGIAGKNKSEAMAKWVVFPYLWVIIPLLVFLYIVDFAHYAYLNQRLNASVLGYLDDATISIGMVWQSYPVIWILLALVLMVWGILFLCRIFYKKIYSTTYKGSNKVRWIFFAAGILLLGISIFGRFNQYPLRWSDAFALGSDFKANIALNPTESFLNTLNFRQKKYDKKLVEEAFPMVAEYYGFQQNPLLDFRRHIPATRTDAGPPPNVVVVILESFSFYKSSVAGNPLNPTPFFDSLSRHGVLFDRCFTPAIGTARGVWAVITGTPDVELQKTASRNPMAVDQHSIINDFKGYEKMYFLGGSTSWANIRGVLTNNIDSLHIYEDDFFHSPVVDVWGISDKSLFEEAHAVLLKQKKPFFAVIQTAGNHRPYTIPSVDIPEFEPLQLPFDTLRKYGFESNEEFNAFRYSDYCMKKFFDIAGKSPYFENTIFAFVGDHGIPGNAYAVLPEAFTDQRLTAMHVPLLFYAPSYLKPQRTLKISSQLDVMPTLAGIAGISYTNTTMGKDLFDSTSREFAFIYDPDTKMAGMVLPEWYYRIRVNVKQSEDEDIRSLTDNNPVPEAVSESVRPVLKSLAQGFYETAKYLLTNNKKREISY